MDNFIIVVVVNCFLIALATSAQASSDIPGQYNILHQHFSAASQTYSSDAAAASRPPATPEFDCLSWRLAVETNNIRDWTLVPKDCVGYVGRYLLGKQYRHDCDAVADVAIKYATSVNLTGDGKDIWVFDIDETSLSNMPYYARSDVAFGSKKYNATKFNEWVSQAKAPALPASLRLYNHLVALGYKIVFLTGSSDDYKQARITNLKAVGYHTWLDLIMKSSTESGSSFVYKSGKRKELEDGGYRIIGNIGDQWSDIIGTNVGKRTFKLPDPMYYIG